MAFLIPDDLAPFASIDPTKAEAMIEDAEAEAVLVAPCIVTPEFANQAAVKSILRAAVLRWNDSGTGAAQTQVAGPFSVTIDTRQERRGLFTPDEITRLQSLCRVPGQGSVFTVSLAGPVV